MIRFVIACCAIVSAAPLTAQSALPDVCPPAANIPERSESQKREAHKLAEQAREAAIIEGSSAARKLFKRAVALDPTDPNTVYALARSYDAAKDPEPAIDQYCRFLALTPNAPEATDVKRRINTLAEDLPKERTTVAAADEPQQSASPEHSSHDATHEADAPTSTASSASTGGILAPTTRIVFPRTKPLSPTVLTLAPIVPGLGQYATHRPFLGALVTASALSALYFGMKREDKSVTTVSGPPWRPVSTTTTTHQRPNLAAGIALALSISTIAEFESYFHARGPTQLHQSRK